MTVPFNSYIPVEVGSFGHFRSGGKGIVETWLALEDLCIEWCGGMWIGIYSARDILDWGRDNGLLSTAEYDDWIKKL